MAAQKIKPKSQTFYRYQRGNKVVLIWRNRFSFYAVVIALLIMNAILWGNAIVEKNIAIWFCKYISYASGGIVIISWLLTGYKLVLAPDYLYFRGGLLGVIGQKVKYNQIKLVYWQYKVDYSDAIDSDSEFVTYLVFANNNRKRISGKLLKEDSDFLKSEIRKFIPQKIAERHNYKTKLWQIFNTNPFPFSVLLTTGLATLAWFVPMGSELSDDRDPSDITRTIIGISTFIIGIGISISINRSEKDKSGLLAKFIYILLGGALLASTYYYFFYC